MNNAIFRERLSAQQAKLAEEKEWWDRKKTSIKEGFMKELDQEAAGTPNKRESAASASTPTSAPTTAAAAATKDSETTSVPDRPSVAADGDAVLVEANADSPAAGGPGSTSSKKKKKGKK